MPHSLNTDKVHQSIFILKNLCLASHSFCKKYEISENSENEKEFTWDYYYGWLRVLVSENLLECAVKVRVLQDVVQEEEVSLQELDKEARIGLDLGSLYGDSNLLTVREACNKVIHATEVSLDWIPVDDKSEVDEAPHFWSGVVKLRGKKGKLSWELALNVENFCIALSRFLCALEDKVDWHHAYKWNY
jgi:hypothetical protein